MNLNRRAFFIESDRYDPYFNQSVEEYLLRSVRDDEIILYLWQNENTVFIGKNQNAVNECDIQLLEKENGHLARRTSGGGAVYHDLGNLNFTFVCKDGLYDLEMQNRIILNAVRKLGIAAEINGRNDLTADSRKFSGHAYYRSKDRRYHHGTLMVDVDKDRLTRYLNVPMQKLGSHAVSSVRSRVVNLKELSAMIGMDDVKDALRSSFEEAYGGNCRTLKVSDLDAALLEDIRKGFADDEWRLGDIRTYQHTRTRKYPDALIQVAYDLDEDMIKDLAVFTDTLVQFDAADLCRRFKGKKINELKADNDLETRIIGLLKGEEDEI